MILNRSYLVSALCTKPNQRISDDRQDKGFFNGLI